MLNINGLKNYWFLPDLYDMRCGAQRVLETYLSIRIAWSVPLKFTNFAVVNQHTESYDIKEIALSESRVKWNI